MKYAKHWYRLVLGRIAHQARTTILAPSCHTCAPLPSHHIQACYIIHSLCVCVRDWQFLTRHVGSQDQQQCTHTVQLCTVHCDMLTLTISSKVACSTANGSSQSVFFFSVTMYPYYYLFHQFPCHAPFFQNLCAFQFCILWLLVWCRRFTRRRHRCRHRHRRRHTRTHAHTHVFAGS